MEARKSTSIMLTVAIAIFFSCDDRKAMEIPVSKKVTSGSLANTKNTSARLATNYSFNGTEGDPIDFTTAQRWTANYQNGDPNGIWAHFFGTDIIKQILNQPGVVGIRMYYARNDKGIPQLILVGVDSSGDDMLPTSLNGIAVMDGSDNTLADASWPCPTYCPGM